ncbi:hypothetical protein QJS10_CPB11g00816 [Acorus calamus]|uniref:Uncharacterized protein n=1 Tax=Acorus calamus TaxID=4465 RepID=A0AAV9DUQ2_ACOCL|nr:hypothetical protein QJS10_CPB11g00816 [Acorus calamus]
MSEGEKRRRKKERKYEGSVFKPLTSSLFTLDDGEEEAQERVQKGSRRRGNMKVKEGQEEEVTKVGLCISKMKRSNEEKRKE